MCQRFLRVKTVAATYSFLLLGGDGKRTLARRYKLKLQDLQIFVNNYLQCLTKFDTFFFKLTYQSVKMIILTVIELLLNSIILDFSN